VFATGVISMTNDPSRPTDESQAADELERRKRSNRSAAAARIEHKSSWVDQQIRVAMAKGEFDNLPGAGKPIKDLGGEHDPDWWLKKLIEREQVTGVLPPALQLRKDDAELDARLDRHTAESEVRRELEEFNARVIKARYTPVDGPPLVTMPRDVDAEVARWRDRMRERREAARRQPAPRREEPPKPGRRARRWSWRSPRP
jgi:hypothetical protein